MVYGRVMAAAAFSREAGDNNCPVDKTRRNWCPACRLRKCYRMQMNKSAVQKERGPRKGKRNISRQEGNDAVGNEKDMVLLECIERCSESSVMTFISASQKVQILTDYWPALFLLYFSSRARLAPLRDPEMNAISQWTLAEGKKGLDPEELRLATCFALCRIGKSCSLLSFASPLEDTYRFWLSHHCNAFYPQQAFRSSHIIGFVCKLLSRSSQLALISEFTKHPSITIQNAFMREAW